MNKSRGRHLGIHLAAGLLAAVVLGGCTRHAREERLLARADKDFAAGNYDKAEVEYRGVLQFEGNPRAIGQLGLLYNEEGRVLQALPFLRRSVELAPKQVDTRVKLSVAYLELGGFKEAREAAKRALADDPANEEALLVLVGSSRGKQDTDDAGKFIAELRRGHPDCAGYHLAQGVLLLGQANSAGAESELRKAIELNPKSATAYLELGNLFAVRRDLQKAAGAFHTAAGLSPVRSSRRLRYLDFLFATGKTDEAKKELAEIETQAPDYVPGLVYAMKVALAERKYAEGEGWIQKILLRDPRNYEALLARGGLKLAQGDPTGAVTELKKAEDAYGRSPQIKYQLAMAYLRSGDLAKAEDRLSQALVVAPSFDQAKLVLAEIDLRKGNTATAVSALTALIQRHPQVGRAYLLLARAYVAQKQPEPALEIYRRLAALLPKDPQVPYFMGLLLAQQNRKPEAREAFEKALQVSPSYGPALDMLVNADLSERHFDAAETRVRALIAKYPKSAGPWLLQAKVDLVRRDLDATESDLGKAIDLDPNGQAAYLELAQVYVAAHKTDQAVAKLTALADKTHSLRPLMQLGLLHTSLGQFEAARADYEKLLAINPKFTPALNNLAYLYSEHLGKLDLAYQYAKQARDGAPEDANAADTLGWVLYRQGDYLGALDLLQEAAQTASENATVQYHLGMTHYMLGEEDPARQALQHVVASAGAGAEGAAAEAARGRLALLAIDPATASSATMADLAARAKAEPQDPIVLTRLAALEARTGSAQEAERHFEAALKLTPRNPRTMLELAQLDAGPLKDPAQARVLAKSAHELAPNDAQISAILGRILYQTGDFKWSLDLLQDAARRLPDDADLQYDLAVADYTVGRVSDAADILNALLGDNRVFLHRERAGRLAAMIAASATPERAAAARAEANRILESDPAYLPALAVSALALVKDGDLAAAALAYEKILAQYALFTPATRQLALIYAQRPGDEQKAYEVAVKARAAYHDDPSVATALGIVDYRRGDYAGAVRLFEESLRRRADDAETFFYIGMSHLSLKQTTEAKPELERSLELGLPTREADSAKRALDDMEKTDQPSSGT